MKRTHVTLTAAAAAVIAAAGIALASGGPPPVQPADPAANTVVSTASGAGEGRRARPQVRRDDRGRRARRPPARAAAAPSPPRAPRPRRSRARRACAIGAIVGIRRDSSPLGYWDQDAGRFGPGTWCGRVYGGAKRVRRADGTIRRVARFHHGCPVPKTASLRVTLTFAAEPG